MGTNSAIEWTHHTFNPWRGCTKVSEGCKHCYAETMSKRYPNTKQLGVWGPRGLRVVAAESYWRQPAKWNQAAAAVGEQHRVFCASLADVFEGPETMPAEAWPAVEAARLRLFRVIRQTPHLDWLLLTKRPALAGVWLDRLAWYADGERGGFSPYLTEPGAGAWNAHPLPNVWLGTSVENQEAADERIPALLSVPARVRFLSCEPLLGPVDLTPWLWRPVHNGPPADFEPRGDLHWVIAGGESGGGARPMHPAWARSLRNQCQAAGVSFFFKQWGEFVPNNGDAVAPNGLPYGGHDDPDGRTPIALPDGTLTDLGWNGGPGPHLRGGVQLLRLGKHRAGRIFDGRTWDEVPA